MTDATLCFRDLSEQQGVSLKRKVEISVLNCQATLNPQPSESSDLRVIELGDKTGYDLVHGPHVKQPECGCFRPTVNDEARFMPLACVRP